MIPVEKLKVNRKAVARLMASVLWAHVRQHCMPAPDLGSELMSGCPHLTYAGKAAGDWLRAHFRRELGKSLADRYFN